MNQFLIGLIKHKLDSELHCFNWAPRNHFATYLFNHCTFPRLLQVTKVAAARLLQSSGL